MNNEIIIKLNGTKPNVVASFNAALILLQNENIEGIDIQNTKLFKVAALASRVAPVDVTGEDNLVFVRRNKTELA